jgi:hypothetical protein
MVWLDVQIEDVKITFHAKISSINKDSYSDSTKSVVDTSSSKRDWFAGTRSSMNTHVTSQTAHANTNTASREFSMEIVVRARQAPIPLGLARVFDMLEAAMKDEKIPVKP